MLKITYNEVKILVDDPPIVVENLVISFFLMKVCWPINYRVTGKCNFLTLYYSCTERQKLRCKRLTS